MNPRQLTYFISLIMIFIFSALNVQAQEPPEILWENTYGTLRLDGASYFVQTSDGGIVVTGYSESFYTNSDIIVKKIDSNGNEIWSQIHGGPQEEKANCIKETTDGGYIITGFTASIGNGSWDVLLLKIDENGNEEWTATFGGSSWDLAYEVSQTADQGFILSGCYYSSDNPNLSDGWLIKTDQFGNLIWDSKFGNFGDDFIFCVQETSDSCYVFTGASDPLINMQGNRNLWIGKADHQGNLLWERKYDGYGERDFGRAVQELPSGGFIVVGNKRYAGSEIRNMWTLITDEEGYIVNDFILGEGRDCLSRSVQPTNDNGYIVSGFIDTEGTGDMNFFMAKLNSNYEEEWNMSMGNENLYEEAFFAQQTIDNGYIIAGYQQVSNSNTEIYVIKTSAETTSNFDEISAPPSYNIQSYPNPFNLKNNTRSNKIFFQVDLDHPEPLKIQIFNQLGQEIKQLQTIKSDSKQVKISWDGRDKNGKALNSGVYFYKVSGKTFSRTKKMILIK